MYLKNIIIIISLILIGYSSHCQEDLNESDARLIRMVLDSGFTEKRAYKYVPRHIKSYLKSVNKGKFKITKRSYNTTDVITSSKLPMRRLLYVGKLKNHYILSYEHGGRGKHQHTLIIDAESMNVKILNLITPFHNNLNSLITIINDKSYITQTTTEL